jgi:hypothetical protein
MFRLTFDLAVDVSLHIRFGNGCFVYFAAEELLDVPRAVFDRAFAGYNTMRDVVIVLVVLRPNSESGSLCMAVADENLDFSHRYILSLRFRCDFATTTIPRATLSSTFGTEEGETKQVHLVCFCFLSVLRVCAALYRFLFGAWILLRSLFCTS